MFGVRQIHEMLIKEIRCDKFIKVAVLNIKGI